jgi:hypothetical protein
LYIALYTYIFLPLPTTCRLLESMAISLVGFMETDNIDNFCVVEIVPKNCIVYTDG